VSRHRLRWLAKVVLAPPLMKATALLAADTRMTVMKDGS